MTVVAAPLAASAATTYKFSIPVQLTGMTGGIYQFACAVGTAQPSLTTSGLTAMTSPYNFKFKGSAFSGTVTAAPVVSQAVAHAYTCVLFQIVNTSLASNGFGPATSNSGFRPAGARVTGKM